MKNLEKYRKKALEMGIDGAKVIDPRTVVTAEWVRLKCQFGCARYGKGLCCPPYTPTPEVTRKLLDSYEKAILFHKRLEKDESSQGLSSMVTQIELDAFFDGYYKAFSMGSGYCRLCTECDPKDRCKHGYEARPSMESCGIDVYRAARDHGFPIQVVRTREEVRNSFGIVLFE